jgi:Tfp pilus assembly protein PilF
MKLPAKPEAKEPFFVMQFYHSHTFPYLIEKCRQEISRLLKDVPTSLRQQVLVPALVALGIVGVLTTRVAQIEQRRALAKPTDNLETYEYVLRARPALQRPDRAQIVEARALFRRAIALDPNYAAAYSGLAETYHLATVMGWAESPSQTLARAEELANTALTRDESDVRAHIILGRIYVFHQQYDQAKAEMDRAIALNPNDAHGLAGRGNILMWLGQTDAAIEALAMLVVDPYPCFCSTLLGRSVYPATRPLGRF